MVIIFLLLLFWENEMSGRPEMLTLELLQVDYPPTDVPVRYCNHMILQRVIKGPENTCKKEHIFIHERPQKINAVCTSDKKMACHNHSTLSCFQSMIKFKMTACELIEGTRYPACRYHVSPKEGFILVTCDDIGAVNFQGFIE
ncbi:PREDICTED: probable inactive ribonuclease-like protein 12 [Chrysochloris asiatica]|uniref:Probable inactive ribonuclease-like protein 12 n=1 Tax=Chrysochloris asiatica TaxID=185453 RepID=A0A9B0WJ55_CHRAS|nr:PREDICTED: probable inactive ribonuclease-like protein 12 [Chrysochloris asiatica]